MLCSYLSLATALYLGCYKRISCSSAFFHLCFFARVLKSNYSRGWHVSSACTKIEETNRAARKKIEGGPYVRQFFRGRAGSIAQSVETIPH